MRVFKGLGGLLIVGGLMMSSVRMMAESKNPADYPLRLHIFGRSETDFYHWRQEEEAKGDGRADLYEGGEARGLDFNYECAYKVRNSFGYETYPARWKKPGQELVVLLPVFGQSGQFFTCHFHTDMKDFAYAQGKNGLHSESVAQFKDWMVRHDYDPEHGKNVPVRNTAGANSPIPAAEGSGEAPPTPPPPPPAPQQ